MQGCLFKLKAKRFIMKHTKYYKSSEQLRFTKIRAINYNNNMMFSMPVCSNTSNKNKTTGKNV